MSDSGMFYIQMYPSHCSCAEAKDGKFFCYPQTMIWCAQQRLELARQALVLPPKVTTT